MYPLSLIYVDEGKTSHAVIWDHFRTYIKWRNFILENYMSHCVTICLEKCILYNSFATCLILHVHMKISLIIIFMIYLFIPHSSTLPGYMQSSMYTAFLMNSFEEIPLRIPQLRSK